MIHTRRTGMIGIDVGTSTVKLVQLMRCNGRLELADARVIKRHSAWPHDDLAARSPLSSGDEIKAGLSLGTGFRGRQAAGLLPMPVCELHALQTSAEDSSPYCDLVADLLHHEIPGSLQEYVYDYWHAESGSTSGTGATNRIYALTAPSSWADRVVTDLRSSRLNCRTLDGLPTALARALELDPTYDASIPVAAIDWGFNRATFCAVLQGQPLYVRCLKNCGFHRVVDALRQALCISDDEAVSLLLQRGIPHAQESIDGNDERQLIGELLRHPLSDFVTEVQRTFAHLQTQRRELVPRRVYLLGGGATIANIEAYLVNCLDLTVTSWKPALGSSMVADQIACLLGPATALSVLAWED